MSKQSDFQGIAGMTRRRMTNKKASLCGEAFLG
jgi:hypothetical protein